uniref:Putative group iv salivary lipocalin n=1 Tax=Rhipicephalus pulchellus TaxID=72859 RepID=L7MC02_RHIPC
MCISQCFWLLPLFASVIPPHHAAITKHYPMKIDSGRGDAIPGPWRFMTSDSIYLNISSVEIPNVLCIQAKATGNDKSAKTLSQKVNVKRRVGGGVTRESIDASYSPIEYTRRGRVKTFTSYDNKTEAVTNYTFLLATPRCAVAVKSKKTKDQGSSECEKPFMEYCKCDKEFKRYDINDCEAPYGSA